MAFDAGNPIGETSRRVCELAAAASNVEQRRSARQTGAQPFQDVNYRVVEFLKGVIIASKVEHLALYRASAAARPRRTASSMLMYSNSALRPTLTIPRPFR